MKKRKIAITTGSRAEYGILRPLLKELSKNKHIETHLIVTGSHLSKKHGLSINEIKKDKYKIAKIIHMTPDQNDMFSSTVTLGKAIVEFAKFFKKHKPDINLVLGDRNEMLASAIAAYQMNIPNAHIHGGDKSGGLDEYTRHAITKISNIHFPATKKSKENIKKMGENEKFIFHFGSLSIDEIKNGKIVKKQDLEKKYNIQFNGKDILLLQHPVTTEESFVKKQINETLAAIKKIKQNTIIIGPNLDPGNNIIINEIKKFKENHNFVHLYSNIPREDYLGFLKNCKVLVGNSSSGMIEASVFKIAVVNIGNRQKNREHGKNVINVKKFSNNQIYSAINKAMKVKKIELKTSNVYGYGNTATKIAQKLEKINLNNRLLKKETSF